jgi:hypothetical protein
MFVMQRQHYLWTAGASTVSVAFTSDVLTRLRQAAGTTDTAEIGGILLGHRESDDRIVVEEFELLPSEHRRGATFTLSQADRKKLAQRLRASHRGLQNLGSFRTHLRHGLYMDQYDFDLMSNHFPGSTDIMLLVRPADWQAGVFIWEDGDIHRQKSYQEFPFDPDLIPLTALPAPAARLRATSPSAASRRFLPTMVKVGLVAATFGLVGVLAFYAHGHHVLLPNVAAVIAKPQPLQPQTIVLPQTDIKPPIDPDMTQTKPPGQDLSEMHVKISKTDTRPSPFNRPPKQSPKPSPKQLEIPQPATPPPSLPPIQSAANIPPAVMAPIRLKPPAPTLVSVVSLEPASPGVLSRGINHIPVLSLLQRNKYKAGDKFSPARPVRQVRPTLPPDYSSPDSVDVKVWIDRTGQVTKAELLSDHAEPEIGDIASNAALKWSFEPARLSDRPVSSEMVMHFRFQ